MAYYQAVSDKAGSYSVIAFNLMRFCRVKLYLIGSFLLIECVINDSVDKIYFLQLIFHCVLHLNRKKQ